VGADGEMQLAEWDRTIAVNLSGTFYVCRAALPHLVAAAGGAIVNLTSVAGFRAWPEDVAYNASKAGVELLTRTIAVEYGKHGVRANCLAPGVIDAGMTDAITQPEERARLVAQHPLGRLGRPTRWPNPLSGCSPAPPRSSRARRWWSTAASWLDARRLVDGGWPARWRRRPHRRVGGDLVRAE
jgi:NAD(P)-dependent dehydrogenase (short-subunit alcohol dehydrogenase family)